MKDIQEIINEMENLSNQMAVTLVDDTSELTAAKKSLTFVPEQPQQAACLDCSGTGGATACANLPALSRLVTFTTSVAAPQGFRFSTGLSSINPRILYDLNCLHCFVEQCICDQNLTRFAVRIVGAIPYIINLRVNPGANQCLSDGDVFLCAHDSVCVDNTLCFGCSEVQALVSCALIDQRFTCANIPVTLRTVFNADATIATITGTFTLPACS